MTTDEYRKQILALLLQKTNVKGEPRFDDAAANELLSQLSDDELEQGMPFNTPDDVADLLAEIGRL
ncbi:MAG: hypothetical protein K6A82_04800 [Prevotella sp.]|nr:hypothetical protein [Prevotella sp.]